jgi:hypothetical protein
VPPEKLDPGGDDPGTPDHGVEGLEGLFLAEPRDPFDEELQVGLNGTEIDVLWNSQARELDARDRLGIGDHSSAMIVGSVS